MTIEEYIESVDANNKFINTFNAEYLAESEGFHTLLNEYIKNTYYDLNVLSRFADVDKMRAWGSIIFISNRHKYALLARTVDVAVIDNFFKTNSITETSETTNNGNGTITDAGNATVTFSKGEQHDTSSTSARTGAQTTTTSTSDTKGAQENSDSVTFSKGEQTNSTDGRLNTGAVTVKNNNGAVTTNVNSDKYTDTTTFNDDTTTTNTVKGMNSTEFVDDNKSNVKTKDRKTQFDGAERKQKTTTDAYENKQTTDAHEDTSHNSSTDGARTDTTTTTATEGARTDTSSGSVEAGERTDTASANNTAGARTDTTTDIKSNTRTLQNSGSAETTKNIEGFNVLYSELVNNARNAALFNLVAVVAHDIVKKTCLLIYDF